RVARYGDLEALAGLAERPGGLEVLLTHQPVDPCRDDRLAVDRRGPREPLRSDQAGRDDAHRGVDRRGGDGDLVAARDPRVDPDAELVGDHLDRLAEAAAEETDHRAGERDL